MIVCTGVANLRPVSQETYTFFWGPQISRRQFVGAIASGALSTVVVHDSNPYGTYCDTKLRAKLVSIEANYDDEYGYVKVRAEVSSGIEMKTLTISYNVFILAELHSFEADNPSEIMVQTFG